MRSAAANTTGPAPAQAVVRVPSRRAFWFWVRLGFINLGRPAGLIPLLAGAVLGGAVAAGLISLLLPRSYPAAFRARGHEDWQ